MFFRLTEPPPSYTFTKQLKKKYDGYLAHEMYMECTVSSSMAIVHWYKGDQKLKESSKYEISKDMSGVCRLTIKSLENDDAGEYMCKLDKQEDKTATKVNVSEYPYKFVKVLKSQQIVEKENITLLCELDDAAGEVKWYKGEEEIVPDKRLVLQIFQYSLRDTADHDSVSFYRMVVTADGRKRKLVIKDCKISDAGMYRCVSNADKTEAELVINCK